jgi:hypothetical protein
MQEWRRRVISVAVRLLVNAALEWEGKAAPRLGDLAPTDRRQLFVEYLLLKISVHCSWC